jgi:predicted O-methyltransferase YrrM
MQSLLINKITRRILSILLPSPFSCRQKEYSLVASFDNEKPEMSDRLLNISIEAIRLARNIDLSDIIKRVNGPSCCTDIIWPGEHYKLLAAIVSVLKPKLVVEIGTYSGESALSMLKTLPLDSKLVTFDIIPWDGIPNTFLKVEDFSNGRMEQCIGDLANPSFFSKNKALLKESDIIFIDGPKNISFEKAFLKNISELEFDNPPLLIFDDIRLWNMLGIWRDIKKPKLDLTSFGHWTGTGLVDWC